MAGHPAPKQIQQPILLNTPRLARIYVRLNATKLAYPAGKRTLNPLPVGTVPSALAGYLTTVAEVPKGNLLSTLAAIGMADVLAHQLLTITKTIALSNLRSKIGIPCPSLSTEMFLPMSVCDHCERAVPTRWHIGSIKNTSDHLTSSLLDRCYTRYIAKSPHRLTPKKRELVQHTLTTLQTQFQKQGANVCCSCALPILSARLLSKHQRTLLHIFSQTSPTLRIYRSTSDTSFLRHTLKRKSSRICYTPKQFPCSNIMPRTPSLRPQTSHHNQHSQFPLGPIHIHPKTTRPRQPPPHCPTPPTHRFPSTSPLSSPNK